MAYSKLRGARKQKKKGDESSSIAEHDAFQEQGKKIIDQLLAHPYFILGTVGGIILLVVVAMVISSYVKKENDKLAYEYAQAVELFENRSGDSTEFKNDAEKVSAAIKTFEKVIENQSGTFNASVSMVYVGRGYQMMSNCEKALDYFNKAKKSGNLSDELLFAVYDSEAICHFDKPDYESAIKTWKEWLDMKSPLYKDHALYYIGLANEKAGKKEEALSYYKRLKNDYPQSSLISKIIDKVPTDPEVAKEPVKAVN